MAGKKQATSKWYPKVMDGKIGALKEKQDFQDLFTNISKYLQNSHQYSQTFGSKHSRLDEVKFVGGSL